jgi:hypothetical protein
MFSDVPGLSTIPSVEAMVKTTYRRSADAAAEDSCKSAAPGMARPLAGLAAPDEVIVNVAVRDATPPDGALDTEIGTDPGWATKVAGIIAVACVALVTVVGICVPFQ